MTDSQAIDECAGFDADDFRSRWRLARLHALDKIAPAERTASESERAASVPPDRQEDLLKEVYLLCRKLGLSAQKHFRMEWEPDDFRQILGKSTDVPCLAGVWSSAGGGQRLSRDGCESQRGRGLFVCQYWREAIDGLVHGLGDWTAFSRHHSVGCGDELCLDIFFPRKAVENRWAPISAELRGALDAVTVRFEKLQVHVEFDGILENQLHFRMKHQKGSLCGASERLYTDMLQRAVRAVSPALALKNASPIAVM